MNGELAKVAARVEDLNKIIQMKTDDLGRKQAATCEIQAELCRVRDSNSKACNDLQCTKVCVDNLAAENAEACKELQCLQQRNAEACCKLSKAEEALKCAEGQLCCTKQDVDCLRRLNNDAQECQKQKCCEKNALTNHTQVLTGQNHDLT